jgi:hypothetical protein
MLLDVALVRVVVIVVLADGATTGRYADTVVGVSRRSSDVARTAKKR